MKFNAFASLSLANAALAFPLFNLFEKKDVVLDTPLRATVSNTTTNGTVTNTTSTEESGASIRLFSFSDDFSDLYYGSETNSTWNTSATSTIELTSAQIFKILGLPSDSGVDSSSIDGFSIESILNSTLNETTVEYEQLSDSFNETTLLELYQAIADDQYDYDGFVVLLDTADIETAAFFVEVIEKLEVPVVFAPLVSLDNLASTGLNDLYGALLVASDEAYNVTDTGVVIVSDYEISSSLYAVPATVGSTEVITSSSELGAVVEGSVNWFFESPEVPQVGGNFTLETNLTLPNVFILEYYSGFSTDILDTLLSSGLDGLVLASSSTTDYSDDVLSEAESISSEIPVVFASSSGGFVTPDDLYTNTTIAAGFLTPIKAKVLVQAAVGSGYTTDETKALFSSVYGG